VCAWKRSQGPNCSPGAGRARGGWRPSSSGNSARRSRRSLAINARSDSSLRPPSPGEGRRQAHVNRGGALRRAHDEASAAATRAHRWRGPDRRRPTPSAPSGLKPWRKIRISRRNPSGLDSPRVHLRCGKPRRSAAATRPPDGCSAPYPRTPIRVMISLTSLLTLTGSSAWAAGCSGPSDAALTAPVVTPPLADRGLRMRPARLPAQQRSDAFCLR
jgi:hypothetical protein